MIEEKENLEALQVLRGDVSWIHYRESLGIHPGVDIVARVDGHLVGLGMSAVDMAPRRRLQSSHARLIANMDWTKWCFGQLERKRVLGIVAFIEAREETALLTPDERVEWTQLCEQERAQEAEQEQQREERQRQNELRELERLQAKYANMQTVKLTSYLGVDAEHFVGERILFQVKTVQGGKCASGRCGRRATYGTVESVGNGGVRLGVRVMGQLVFFNIDKDGKIEQTIDIVKGGTGD